MKTLCVCWIRWCNYTAPCRIGCPAGKTSLQASLRLTWGWIGNSAPWRDIAKLAMVLGTYFCRQIWRDIAKSRQTWRPFGDILGPSPMYYIWLLLQFVNGPHVAVLTLLTPLRIVENILTPEITRKFAYTRCGYIRRSETESVSLV